MAELEEGEITDSDTECTPVVNIQRSFDKGKEDRFTSEKNSSFQAASSNAGYRSLKPRHLSSDDSDSSNYSDEDTDLWRCKKAKYFSSSKANERAMIMDLPQEIQSPKRPLQNLHNYKDQNTATMESQARRKINNVWGSVLTEQSLTQGLKGVGVERNEHLDESDRNVEKYDFTKAYEDDRPFLADKDTLESNDPFQKVVELQEDPCTKSEYRGKKRKRYSVESHRRRPTLQDLKSGDDFGVSEDDPEEKIINVIAKLLDEPRVDLIEKIVLVAGKKKAIETLYATAEVESSGGMLTNDGSRRRSPGGSFFTILKTDSTLPKSEYDSIYGEEDRRYNKHRKEMMKRRKQNRSAKKRINKMLPQAKLLCSNKMQESQSKDNDENECDEKVSDEEEGEENDTTMETNLNPTTEPIIDSSDTLDIAVDEDDVID